MAPFNHILVPIDFSDTSSRALEKACELARLFQAPLTLFHAYALPTYPLPEGFVLPSPETVTEILAKTQDALKSAAARAQSLGAPRVDALMNEGSAFVEIVRVAREKNVDLI